ncbi:1861_t:CDS:2, partial [Acaulospora colombiana]
MGPQFMPFFLMIIRYTSKGLIVSRNTIPFSRDTDDNSNPPSDSSLMSIDGATQANNLQATQQAIMIPTNLAVSRSYGKRQTWIGLDNGITHLPPEQRDEVLTVL